MRFASVDWGDDAVYLIGFVALLLIVMVLLERVAPTRSRGRQPRSRRREEDDLI